MAGAYIWQTNLDGHRQNDALLFGGGMEYNPKGWRIQFCGSGYLGYMRNQGDKPILLRGLIEQTGKSFNSIVKFQQGLNNFNYSSVEAGVRYTVKNRQ